MSLMERVQSAGVDSSYSQELSSLDELKKRIADILPPQRLAQLAQNNPKQAESEIRHASEQVMQTYPWLAEGLHSTRNIAQVLINDVFGLGPLEPYLADNSVTEIMVNGTQSLYIEKNGRLQKCKTPFTHEDVLRGLIDKILGPLGRRIDESSPMVDARLASGYRVNATLPPITPDGPTLTIRKFSQHVFSLSDLSRMGTIDETLRQFFVWAIVLRKNIAVSGGTGSGKTTFLNALSCAISHTERIVTIEDSAELRFLEHPHVVRMEARNKNAEGLGEVTIRDLVKNALRMRPDRIIVGEVRGGEALDMLNAMNTGHDGSLTTLHSNSVDDAIVRLSTMVRFAADLPLSAIEAQIGGALDIIVQMSRLRDGHRVVSQVSEVIYSKQEQCVRTEVLYVRDQASGHGSWLAAPSWLLANGGESFPEAREVRAWMCATQLMQSVA